MDCSPQAPLSIRFSRQGCWSGLPFLPPGDLPDPGIEAVSPPLAGELFTTEPPGKPPEGSCNHPNVSKSPSRLSVPPRHLVASPWQHPHSSRTPDVFVSVLTLHTQAAVKHLLKFPGVGGGWMGSPSAGAEQWVNCSARGFQQRLMESWERLKSAPVPHVGCAVSKPGFEELGEAARLK